MEHKIVKFEVKEIDEEEGIFTGYAATFSKIPDCYGDIIDKGAFKKTIKERIRDIQILWSHHAGDLPIGKPIEMVEDEKGLLVKGKLSLGVQMAREVLSLLKDGVLTKMSIGYNPVKETWQEGIRHLQEIMLFDVSPVNFPANPEAVVVDVKSELELRDYEILDSEASEVKFAGSPKNKYGTHASKGFKGNYAAAWRCHFSQVGGGDTSADASGPIRGTVRRCAMIAAVMKPPCDLIGTDSVAARKGPKSPLECTFPDKPSDYGLSTWAKPSDDGLEQEDIRLTCADLNVIKKAALAEIKRRAEDREEEEAEKEKTYKCECIKCGYKLTSEKHCSDIKCPKCGGEMRRAERPGPGKSERVLSDASLEKIRAATDALQALLAAAESEPEPAKATQLTEEAATEAAKLEATIAGLKAENEGFNVKQAEARIEAILEQVRK